MCDLELQSSYCPEFEACHPHSATHNCLEHQVQRIPTSIRSEFPSGFSTLKPQNLRIPKSQPVSPPPRKGVWLPKGVDSIRTSHVTGAELGSLYPSCFRQDEHATARGNKLYGHQDPGRADRQTSLQRHTGQRADAYFKLPSGPWEAGNTTSPGFHVLFRRRNKYS